MQNRLLGCIRHVVSSLELRTEPDHELLRRFVSQCDEAAFTAIVRRHGPMVMRVAVRTLQNEHDAEDVFQATFLVLSQKAHSLRRQGSLGSWLYGIAYRIALKTKATAGGRRNREQHVTQAPVAGPLTQITVQEAQTILDEELDRLPDQLREPVVLCCLEGLARDEAARRIGCPPGVLKSRLERGRERLRLRLIARGLTLPCGLGVFLLLECAAGAAAPPALVASTTKAAITIAAGNAATTVVTAEVAALTEGVLRTMLLTKLKLGMALLMVAGLFIGASGMIFKMQAAEQKTEKPDTQQRAAAGRVAQDAIALQAGAGKGGDAAQDAEKLYWAMEKKVRGARSLHVALDGGTDSQALKGTMKATIYATQGNKSRMEIDLDLDGKIEKLLFLTDGKSRYTKQGDKGTLDADAKKAEQEGKHVPGILARIGITGALLMARSAKPGEEKAFDLDKDAPVTNFKLGAKETVGDKTAQVVTYKLDFAGTSVKMSVWIDTKTQLPLKRVVAVDQDGKMFRITETYSTFTIDGKLEPKLFEIPNE